MNKKPADPKTNNRNILWIIITFMLLAGNIILLVSFINAKSSHNRGGDNPNDIPNYDIELSDCRVRLEDAIESEKDKELEIGSLQRKIKKLEEEVIGISTLSPEAIKEFREKGLNSPERDIINDLMNHPEMIPIKPTEGGKMGFYDRKKIFVLNKLLVYAYFTDGSKKGTMILEYEVAQGGKITWKPVKAYEL